MKFGENIKRKRQKHVCGQWTLNTWTYKRKENHEILEYTILISKGNSQFGI